MDERSRGAREAAAIALMNAGAFAGAEARLKSMLAENSSDARALALLSRCRAAAGDKKGALEASRAAAAIAPEDMLVRRALVDALLRNELYEEGWCAAASLARDNPGDADALFDLAIAHMGRNDGVGAHRLLDQAEQHAEGDAVTLLNLALLRARQWRWADAERLARRSLALDPGRPETFSVLAECSLAAKRPQEACELALEALRLAPDSKQAMRLMARAKARGNVLLRPLLPLVDWILEMDVNGLAAMPALAAIIAAVLALSVSYDASRLAAHQAPVLFVSIALGALLLLGGAAYAAALSARLGIRRDLRKVALPKF